MVTRLKFQAKTVVRFARVAVKVFFAFAATLVFVVVGCFDSDFDRGSVTKKFHVEMFIPTSLNAKAVSLVLCGVAYDAIQVKRDVLYRGPVAREGIRQCSPGTTTFSAEAFVRNGTKNPLQTLELPCKFEEWSPATELETPKPLRTVGGKCEIAIAITSAGATSTTKSRFPFDAPHPSAQDALWFDGKQLWQTWTP